MYKLSKNNAEIKDLGLVSSRGLSKFFCELRNPTKITARYKNWTDIAIRYGKKRPLACG